MKRVPEDRHLSDSSISCAHTNSYGTSLSVNLGSEVSTQTDSVLGDSVFVNLGDSYGGADVTGASLSSQIDNPETFAGHSGSRRNYKNSYSRPGTNSYSVEPGTSLSVNPGSDTGQRWSNLSTFRDSPPTPANVRASTRSSQSFGNGGKRFLQTHHFPSLTADSTSAQNHIEISDTNSTSSDKLRINVPSSPHRAPVIKNDYAFPKFLFSILLFLLTFPIWLLIFFIYQISHCIIKRNRISEGRTNFWWQLPEYENQTEPSVISQFRRLKIVKDDGLSLNLDSSSSTSTFKKKVDCATYLRTNRGVDLGYIEHECLNKTTVPQLCWWFSHGQFLCTNFNGKNFDGQETLAYRLLHVRDNISIERKQSYIEITSNILQKWSNSSRMCLLYKCSNNEFNFSFVFSPLIPLFFGGVDCFFKEHPRKRKTQVITIWSFGRDDLWIFSNFYNFLLRLSAPYLFGISFPEFLIDCLVHNIEEIGQCDHLIPHLFKNKIETKRVWPKKTFFERHVKLVE